MMEEDVVMMHPNSPREVSISHPTEVLVDGKKRKCIGNYTLGKKLGRGSFCKVRVATHNLTGCKYAMKILKPGDRKSSFEDLEREIRVLSGLRHPHVIGLHDVLYMDNTNAVVVGTPTCSLKNAKKLYLVVDLATNGELFEYIIKKRRVQEDEARWLFRQIISAVEYLHAHCIAHRDLKPENILLDTQNTVKLNDFGLSNFVQPEKKMKTFCGSPVYAAPEVMRKSYYDGVIADVWSLGVILFTMVTGCLPWKLDAQTNRIENIEDLLAGRFAIPTTISSECASLLSKMLVADPSQRARLNEVRKHSWVNKGYLDYPPRYLEPNMPVTEIDKVVLRQMEAMGFMQARVCQDVWGNKLKPSVTIYHTLLKRRNLLLLLNSTPATRSPPVSPNKTPQSPKFAPKAWTPMEIVYEEPSYAAAPPTPPSSLPSSKSSLTKWIKDLTNVKPVSDMDFRETRVAIPTSHGISNFLKRRHSVPETQNELRMMHAAEASVKAKKEKDKSSVLQRILSRVRRSSVGVGAIPAA